MSPDMIKLQLSQHLSCDTKSDRVTLCCDFYTFIRYNTCTFSLPTFAHMTIFRVVMYIIKQLFYETAWSILFQNHANYVTSLVKIHREY